MQVHYSSFCCSAFLFASATIRSRMHSARADRVLAKHTNLITNKIEERLCSQLKVIFLWILTSIFTHRTEHVEKRWEYLRQHAFIQWVFVFERFSRSVHPLTCTMPKCTLVARNSFYFCAFCSLLLLLLRLLLLDAYLWLAISLWYANSFDFDFFFFCVPSSQWMPSCSFPN